MERIDLPTNSAEGAGDAVAEWLGDARRVVSRGRELLLRDRDGFVAGVKTFSRESTLRVIRYALQGMPIARWAFNRFFTDNAEAISDRAIDQLFAEVEGRGPETYARACDD